MIALGSAKKPNYSPLCKQCGDHVQSKMVVCVNCGDYSYRCCDPGECSVCAEYGRVSPMHYATPEQQCDACCNLHRSDFLHTCGKETSRA